MFFGKIKKSFSVDTVVLALDFKPLLIPKPPYEEVYPFWQLFYVSRGEMRIEREGVSHTVSAGELLLRPPGTRSTMHYPEDCALYMGLVDFMMGDDSPLSALGNAPIPLDEKEKKQVSELIREASDFFRDPPEGALWQEMLCSSLETFLTRLYGRVTGVFPAMRESEKARTQRCRSETVERINLILEERRFSTVTVDELASLLGESPNVLMKLYRHEMHESIIEHFLHLKLGTAIQLIMTSDMTFTEISELLGFSSVGYFSKFFKKRTGMTPTEYSKTGGIG